MSSYSFNLNTIKQLDKSKMLDLLLDFPLQCQIAFQLSKEKPLSLANKNFSNIVFCGMGGSAIGGDLVRAYLYFDAKIPIFVCRDYNLAGFIDEKSLVFLSSYSGETEETISAYLEAKKKTSNIICISSGGKLKEMSLNDKFSFFEIPKGFPPRCALGYLSIIPLGVLARLNLISNIDSTIEQMIKELEQLRDTSLSPRINLKDNAAKYIAKKIFNRFVVIYTAAIHFDVCALRLKAQINENAKAPAAVCLFPELNHNEIVGWQNPKKILKNFTILNLKDTTMHPRILKRMEITKEILQKERIEFIDLNAKGSNLLSKIFSLIYIGDFISFYLAMLYGIDPTPVERISYLKKKLAQI